jgi:hypothetical protein
MGVHPPHGVTVWPTTLQDAVTNKKVNIEASGAMAVAIQDQHTPSIDAYFSQQIGATTALGVDAVVDSYTVTMAAGHGVLVNEMLLIVDTLTGRTYYGEVLGVAVNDLTLDTPINHAYPAANSDVYRTTREMDVNGAITRQTFSVGALGTATLDITRIMFKIITTDAPDMDEFGDIAGGLTRGLVLRIVNSKTTNLFNVKTNGEMINLMYDVTFFAASGPGPLGSNGLGGRLTYAGPEKHGVTLRLGPGDVLEAIIQDDLTSLLSFRMIAAGHVVTD